jgi:hypothetical protein
MTATAPERVRPRLVPMTCGLVAAALLVAGCGSPPDRNAPVGTTVTRDGVAYAVQTSGQLNPLETDERELLGGRSKRLDTPRITLGGVFVQARNNASALRRAFAAPTASSSATGRSCCGSARTIAPRR